MPDHDPIGPLSPEGTARRDAMRDALMARVPGEAMRRRRRRAIGRACVVLGVAAIGAILILPGRTPPQQVPQIIGLTANTDEPPPARVTIERIPTDPGAVARATPQRHPGVRVDLLTDDELLRTLESIGRPTGFVRTPDAAWVTGEVTDEQLVNREG